MKSISPFIMFPLIIFFIKPFPSFFNSLLFLQINNEVYSGTTNELVDEFLDELNLNKLKMAVSTIPEFETNLLLINKIRQTNKKAIIMVVSHNIEEANILYDKGATYVVMPHFLGGHHTSIMIGRNKLSLNKFLIERKKHLKYLKTKKELGHEHPKAEKNR